MIRPVPSPAWRCSFLCSAIGWGDGTAQQNISRAAGNASRTITHTYANTGTYQISVTALDKDGATSDVATRSVDIVPPPTITSSTINNGTKMRSRITDINFVLSADAALALSALTLKRGGVAVPLSAAGFNWDSNTFTASLDMSHVKLDNGNYTLEVNSGAGTLHVDFYKLQGDSNGDRIINKKDLKNVKRSLNKVAGQAGYRAYADLNANNKVDNKDLKLVKKNLKKRLPPP